MADEDYYHILDVPRDGDENAIKKAYRKLAIKWHPDKNPDNKEESEERFKKISEAYDVLSDKEKKPIYDKYGKDGLTGAGAGGGGRGGHHQGFSFNFGHGGGGFAFRNADDIFRDFFEHDPFGDDILAEFFGPRRRGNRSSNGNVSRRDPFGHFGGFGGFGSGFGGFSNNDQFFSNSGFGGGFSTSSSFSSGGGGSFKSSSTSTKMVNGKKILTKKVVENGKETVEVFENNVLVKRTVDGVPQITGGESSVKHKIKGARR